MRDSSAPRARHSSRLALLAAGVAAFLFAEGAAHAQWSNWLPSPKVKSVVAFDASRLETPESIAIDSNGNKYVSLCLTGEIRRMAPDGTQTTFATLPIGAPPLTPCGPYVGGLVGIAFDRGDNLYAALASCSLADRGVWRVSPSGTPTILGNLPMEGLPNGIAFHHGDLYIADSALGLVWRMAADGSAPPEVWADDPLLKPGASHAAPGPNGVQFFGDVLYVSNSDQQKILSIPIRHDGAAGRVRTHASNVWCDDFAFDVLGDIYCTTDPSNTVVRIFPNGSSKVLLSAADGLDGPTAAVFGTHGTDIVNLYVTNAAYPFFSVAHKPSVMKVAIGIPGAPRPW